jgi:Fe-S-cluster containining protein
MRNGQCVRCGKCCGQCIFHEAKKKACLVYKFRPGVCRMYPLTPEDLEQMPTCWFYFKE